MFSFLFAFDFSSVFAIVCDGVRCKPAVLHRWRAFLQSAIVQLQLTLQDCALQPNNNPTEIRSKDLANLPQVQQKIFWEDFDVYGKVSPKQDKYAVFFLPFFKPYFHHVFCHILNHIFPPCFLYYVFQVKEPSVKVDLANYYFLEKMGWMFE